MSWLRLGLVISIFAVLWSQLSIWSMTFAYDADGGFGRLSIGWFFDQSWVISIVLLGIACTQLLKYQEKSGVLGPVRYLKLGWVLNIFAALMILYVVWEIATAFFYMEAMSKVGFVNWFKNFFWVICNFSYYALIALLCLTLSRQLSVTLAAKQSDHEP